MVLVAGIVIQKSRERRGWGMQYVRMTSSQKRHRGIDLAIPRLTQNQNCSNWTGRHLEAEGACHANKMVIKSWVANFRSRDEGWRRGGRKGGASS